MNNTKGYAAQSATDALAPFSFQRREVRAHDIQIDIHIVASAIPIFMKSATNGEVQSILTD